MEATDLRGSDLLRFLAEETDLRGSDVLRFFDFLSDFKRAMEVRDLSGPDLIVALQLEAQIARDEAMAAEATAATMAAASRLAAREAQEMAAMHDRAAQELAERTSQPDTNG